jgi:hypothetical protein
MWGYDHIFDVLRMFMLGNGDELRVSFVFEDKPVIILGI